MRTKGSKVLRHRSRLQDPDSKCCRHRRHRHFVTNAAVDVIVTAVGVLVVAVAIMVVVIVGTVTIDADVVLTFVSRSRSCWAGQGG